ncbi:MAG: hypothetical protein Q9170_002311 [Blastenia crenularia]
MPLLTAVATRFRDAFAEYVERIEDSKTGHRNKHGRKTQLWHEREYERERRARKRQARRREKDITSGKLVEKATEKIEAVMTGAMPKDGGGRVGPVEGTGEREISPLRESLHSGLSTRAHVHTSRREGEVDSEDEEQEVSDDEGSEHEAAATNTISASEIRHGGSHGGANTTRNSMAPAGGSAAPTSASGIRGGEAWRVGLHDGSSDEDEDHTADEYDEHEDFDDDYLTAYDYQSSEDLLDLGQHEHENVGTSHKGLRDRKQEREAWTMTSGLRGGGAETVTLDDGSSDENEYFSAQNYIEEYFTAPECPSSENSPGPSHKEQKKIGAEHEGKTDHAEENEAPAAPSGLRGGGYFDDDGPVEYPPIEFDDWRSRFEDAHGHLKRVASDLEEQNNRRHQQAPVEFSPIEFDDGDEFDWGDEKDEKGQNPPPGPGHGFSNINSKGGGEKAKQHQPNPQGAAHGPSSGRASSMKAGGTASQPTGQRPGRTPQPYTLPTARDRLNFVRPTATPNKPSPKEAHKAPNAAQPGPQGKGKTPQRPQENPRPPPKAQGPSRPAGHRPGGLPPRGQGRPADNGRRAYDGYYADAGQSRRGNGGGPSGFYDNRRPGYNGGYGRGGQSRYDRSRYDQPRYDQPRYGNQRGPRYNGYRDEGTPRGQCSGHGGFMNDGGHPKTTRKQTPRWISPLDSDSSPDEGYAASSSDESYARRRRKPAPPPPRQPGRNGAGRRRGRAPSPHPPRPVRDQTPPPSYEDVDSVKAAPPNHYSTLGIRRDATPDQIAAASKQMRVKYHPDKLLQLGHGKTPEEVAKINDKAGRVGQAAVVLGDPRKKWEYDIEIYEWEWDHGGRLPAEKD